MTKPIDRGTRAGGAGRGDRGCLVVPITHRCRLRCLYILYILFCVHCCWHGEYGRVFLANLYAKRTTCCGTCRSIDRQRLRWGRVVAGVVRLSRKSLSGCARFSGINATGNWELATGNRQQTAGLMADGIGMKPAATSSNCRNGNHRGRERDGEREGGGLADCRRQAGPV